MDSESTVTNSESKVTGLDDPELPDESTLQHLSALKHDPNKSQSSEVATDKDVDYQVNAEPVEETKGKPQGQLSEFVTRFTLRASALGHLELNGPMLPGVSDLSDPTTPNDAQQVKISPTQLKNLIVDNEHVTRTNMSPMIFIIDGLAQCGKSEALMKLLHKVIPKSRNDAMTKVSEKDVRAGISYYELAAVGLPPAPFDRLTYSETTNRTSYLFAFQSALKQLYYSRGQEILFHDPSAGEKEVVFDDEDLNDHLHKIFDSLASDQQREPSSLEVTNWKRFIPSGIAVINVWDIGMNKAVFHFLPALWGHLNNSYLWLFLDLDRDLKKLYDAPNLPENTFNKARKDKDLVMQYRSRMEYLLRPAMLAKSSSDDDRENVCSVFGVHSGTYEDSQLHSLLEEIRNASTQAHLATVVNTEKVTPINPKDGNCWKALKKTADEIIGTKLESTSKISLASVFLRSLYYAVDKMYVEKSELKAKADVLKMTDKEFEKFCQVFMSCGSIIDVNLIDNESNYVILRPTEFICSLDKVFYPPPESDCRVSKFGIVTESTALKIFEPGTELMPGRKFQHGDHKFIMDVLVSVDLALKLDSHQIESYEFTQEEVRECYYIPDVRTSPPSLKCQPYALHLLYSTNSPLRHLLVLFTRALLEIKPDTKLVFKETSPINITTYKIISSETNVAVDFEMRYLGEAVEFRVPPTADEDICASIIRSCHQMMESKWRCDKYNFAVMCSKDPDPNTPSRLHRKRHLLPDETLCETCEKEYSQEMLSKWNITVKKNAIASKRKLNGEPLSHDDIVYIAEKLQNEAIKEDTLHKIATMLGFKEGLKEECFNNIDLSRIPFMLILEWERKIKQGGFKEKEASKKVLARTIMEIADSMHKQSELLQTLARKLDMRVTPAH